MKINLYSVKDCKIGFNTLFDAPNNACAIRMFADSVNKPDTPLAQHPEDYQLFFIGTRDDETGDLESKPTFLENATAFTK